MGINNEVGWLEEASGEDREEDPAFWCKSDDDVIITIM